jgi:Ca2+-binding RTX toxin-like protein
VGGTSGDTLDGGAGTDTASYETATSYVIADLSSTSSNRGDASGDKYSSIENLTGSAYADTLRGNSGANVLKGGAGADKLYGRDGSDTLNGGAGSDTLDGGTGTDTAEYLGSATDYSWARNSDGSWTVTDLRSGAPDGVDRLVGIENLKFAGGATIGLGAMAAQPPGSALSASDQFLFDFAALGTGGDAVNWPDAAELRDLLDAVLDGSEGWQSAAQELLESFLDLACHDHGSEQHGLPGRSPLAIMADDWLA